MWTDEAFSAANEPGAVKFSITVTIGSAQVEHVCEGCCELILIGDTYSRQVTMCVGDDKPVVIKLHQYCA